MMKYLIICTFCLLVGCASLKLDPKCRLKPDPGPCKGAFTMYYFDKTEQQCKEFTWGGCHGTVPFETMEECQACLETP